MSPVSLQLTLPGYRITRWESKIVMRVYAEALEAPRLCPCCGGDPLGAPLKGIVWESTAVPEIRVHAAEVARRILAVPSGTFPIPSECARAPDRASRRSPAS